jgi:hypothetical protein
MLRLCDGHSVVGRPLPLVELVDEVGAGAPVCEARDVGDDVTGKLVDDGPPVLGELGVVGLLVVEGTLETVLVEPTVEVGAIVLVDEIEVDDDGGATGGRR